MAKRYASMAGAFTACLDTDASGDKEAIRFAAHVPDFVWLEETPEQTDFEPTSTVSDDLPHLLYGQLRKALLERGLYPVHAACVGDHRGHVLLVGHSGAGKTTLAQKLIDDFGMTLFSGNKTVVALNDSSANAIAGTRVMTALDESGKRVASLPPTGSLSPEKSPSIRAIFMVRVNEGVQSSKQLEPLSALHTLYPLFTDAVNADVVVEGRHLFDGSVTPEAKQRLVTSLADTLKKIPVFVVTGSFGYMAERVMAP